MASSQVLGIFLADVLAASVPTGAAFALVTLEALSAVLLVLACLTRRAGLRALLACLLCTCIGSISLLRQFRTATWPYPESVVERIVEGRVEDRHVGSGWSRFRLRDVRGLGPGPAPPQRVEVLVEEREGGVATSAQVGQQLRLYLRLRPVRSLQNPGARPHVRRLRRAGVGASARLLHPALAVIISKPEGRLQRGARYREELARRLEGLGPGSALLRALALGDRAGLAKPDREAIAKSGLSHLLAVSGLHLGLVGLGGYSLLWFFARRLPRLAARFDLRLAALVLACVATAFYAFLVGWGIPVRRALCVFAALVLGLIANRRARGMHSLALAAMLILAAEPQALFAPGAQMSFAVSAALLLSMGRDEIFAGFSLLAYARNLLRVSLTAVMVSAPIAATCFGALAPAGVLWNMLAVPWTACVLLPGALLATFWVALRPVLLPWEMVLLGGFTRGVGEGSLQAARAAASLLPPLAVSAAPAWPWLAAAMAVALLGVRVRGLPLLLAAAGGCLTLLALAPPAPVSPQPPRVVFLDVGQGDATIIQGRGVAMLVDAGTAFPSGGSMGAVAVLPALRALGIARLDLVVVSHADLDHRGGIPEVLKALPVEALWLPRGSAEDPAYADLYALARARGVALVERGTEDLPLRLGEFEIETLWPDRAFRGGDRNDHSLVLRVSRGAWRLLLPGDLEQAGEAALLARGADLAATWLKLGHHGSRTSSSAAFLDAVSAEEALVSAPCGGRFGMPHAEVLERVRARGARLWWTGRDGAVLADEEEVRSWRGPGARCVGSSEPVRSQ